MHRATKFFAFLFIFFLIVSPVAAKTKREEAQGLMKKLAKSRDVRVRANAAWRLGQMGAIDSVPALIVALEDTNRSVRANAAGALWNLGEVSRPAIPALHKSLADPYAGVIGNAAGALVKLGTPKSELMPVYRRLLAEEKCRFRVWGLEGLYGLVRPAELFHDALECSRHGELKDRFKAGDVLRDLMDPKDNTMIPLILEALKTSGDQRIVDLAIGIVNYKPPVAGAVPLLEHYLGSKDHESRRIAAESLGRLKGVSKPALPRLLILLESDPDADVRAKCAEAIGDIGSTGRNDKRVIPPLMKAAEHDRWPKVRSASIGALSKFREDAKPAIPLLHQALRDPDDSIRISARNALFRIDPKNNAKIANGTRTKASVASKTMGGKSLFEDAMLLSETLITRIPKTVELLIYNNFAIATAPEPTSRSGYGRFTYRRGEITGPDEGHPTCKKTFNLGKVDFSLLPKLVQEAKKHAKMASGTVTHVIVSRGVFCKKTGWYVYLKDGGKMSFVEFRLNGKFTRVTH